MRFAMIQKMSIPVKYILSGLLGGLLMLMFGNSMVKLKVSHDHKYLNSPVFCPASTSVYEINNDTMIAADNTSIFRKRFLLWDHANTAVTLTLGPDHVTQPERYLIYRCGGGFSSLCGGWADRVRGMMLAYVIANVTGRVFKAEILNPPCDLTQYLVPNSVNWSLPVSIHKRVSNDLKDVHLIDMLDNVKFRENIENFNFTETFGRTQSKYIYFIANNYYFAKLRETKVHRQELAWMRGLSPEQVRAALYQRLFKLSPRFQTRMDNFMSQTLPTAKHRLVCAHIRMGPTSVTPDDYVYLTKDKVPAVWRFLSNHSSTDFDKIFIMSDSPDVVKEAKYQPFKHRIVETEGPVLHVERSRGFTSSQRCDGLEKVIFDQHVLMQCDVLLISASGLSRLAADVRASIQGLYCLRRTGIIEPCHKSI